MLKFVRYSAFSGDMNDLKGNTYGYITTTAENMPDLIAPSFITFEVWSSSPIQIAVGSEGFAIRRFLFSAWGDWILYKK